MLELNLNLSMDQRRFGTSCGSIADMGNIIVPMSLSPWQWGELAGKV